MAKGKFEISMTDGGNYTYRLLTVGGRVVTLGGEYKTLPVCKKGIASLRINSDAPICDLTAEFSAERERAAAEKCPKIEIFAAEGGYGYCYRVRAKNGSEIARGQVTGTKLRCLEAVETMKKIAFSAESELNL